MGTIADQLFRVGLVSEKSFREQQAERDLEDERRSSAQIAQLSQQKKTELDELDECVTMHDFKFAAKKILLKDPSKIRVIINKAHRFINEEQGRRFIKFFYQVRDVLKKLPDGAHVQFLEKAFRKHGSVLGD
jgi:hypothetical protein